MSYIDAFLHNPSGFMLLGIIAILIASRLRYVKFGRGTAFFEIAFGASTRPPAERDTNAPPPP